MGVEHIRIGSLRTQQETENAKRMVAISKPGPKIDAPRRRPSRRLIAADLKGTLCRGCQFRRIPAIDLPTRIEAEQVRNVTMMDVLRLHVPIFQPFLQLPCAADLFRREASAGRRQFCAKIGIDPEDLSRMNGIGKKIAKDLHVHRRSGRNRRTHRVNVLGRKRWIRD